MNLTAVWIVIAVVAAAFFGFVEGQTRERERWSAAIGACDLPTTRLDALEIIMLDSGKLGCYRRNR